MCSSGRAGQDKEQHPAHHLNMQSRFYCEDAECPVTVRLLLPLQGSRWFSLSVVDPGAVCFAGHWKLHSMVRRGGGRS